MSDSDLQRTLIMGGMTISPGQTISSYRYIRPIGRGGMADVLLATDPNGNQLALKVLKESRFRTGKRRFKREYRAVAKIRHPNVIRVISYGDIYSHPFIAMEYVQGTDLHKIIRSFSEHSLSYRWEKAEKYLKQLASGLTCIHNQGLIHRDLKPSNILVDIEDNCKITDFGIVKTLEQEVEESTTLVGTWAYSSPEQISGQPIDHRSDLYSLGIILYAMLTSRRPFSADNMSGYLKLHKSQPPTPPSHFIKETPSMLEAICLKLLEKAPNDRYQSAEEILEQLGESVFSSRQRQNTGPWRMPFKGREREMRIVDKQAFFLQEGTGAILQFVGSDGIGKTRLLHEINKTLRNKKQFSIFYGRVSAKQNTLEMLLMFAKYIAKETVDIELNALVHAIDSNRKQENLNSEINLRHQLFDRTLLVLQNRAEQKPLIFLIDDLHYATGPLQELIQFLSRSLLERGQLPLLLIGTSDRVLDWLPNKDVHKLNALTEKDIEDILRDLCGAVEDLDILAETYLGHTEGNPVFLTEFLRDLLQKNLLLEAHSTEEINKHILEQKTIQSNLVSSEGENHQKDKTTGLSDDNITFQQLFPYKFAYPPLELAKRPIDVPLSLRSLARSRMENLDAISREILLLIVVIGQEIDLDTLVDIALLLPYIDVTEGIILDSLEKLKSYGYIIYRQIGFDSLIEFSRRKLGEIIYEEILPNKRMSLHLKIAQVIEQKQNLTMSKMQLIGQHYSKAQMAGKAFWFLSKACKHLWEQGVANKSLDLLDESLSIMRQAKSLLSSAEFLQARLSLLQVQFFAAENQGNFKLATKILRSLLRYSRESKDIQIITMAELGLSRILLDQGDYAACEERIRRVLHFADKHKDNKIAITALHHLCAAAWEQGNLDQCELLANLGLQRATKQDIARAQVLLSIGAIDAVRGRIFQAEEHMKEAIQIFIKFRHKKKLATVYANLSEVQFWQGKWMLAMNNIQQSLNISQDIFNRMGISHALLTKSVIFFHIGMLSESQKFLDDGMEISRDLGSQSNINTAYYIQSLFYLYQKKYDQLQNISIQGIVGCFKSDPESYLQVFYALYLISHLFQTSEVDTTFVPEEVNLDTHALLVEIQQKINHSATIPARKLDLQLFLGIYFFHTQEQKRSFALLQNCYQQAKEEGLWLWVLKSSFIANQLLEQLPSDVELPETYDFQTQRTEILTQLSEPLTPDIQIRMLRHYR